MQPTLQRQLSVREKVEILSPLQRLSTLMSTRTEKSDDEDGADLSVSETVEADTSGLEMRASIDSVNILSEIQEKLPRNSTPNGLDSLEALDVSRESPFEPRHLNGSLDSVSSPPPLYHPSHVVVPVGEAQCDSDFSGALPRIRASAIYRSPSPTLVNVDLTRKGSHSSSIGPNTNNSNLQSPQNRLKQKRLWVYLLLLVFSVSLLALLFANSKRFAELRFTSQNLVESAKHVTIAAAASATAAFGYLLFYLVKNHTFPTSNQPFMITHKVGIPLYIDFSVSTTLAFLWFVCTLFLGLEIGSCDGDEASLRRFGVTGICQINIVALSLSAACAILSIFIVWCRYWECRKLGIRRWIPLFF